MRKEPRQLRRQAQDAHRPCYSAHLGSAGLCGTLMSAAASILAAAPLGCAGWARTECAARRSQPAASSCAVPSKVLWVGLLLLLHCRIGWRLHKL